MCNKIYTGNLGFFDPLATLPPSRLFWDPLHSPPILLRTIGEPYPLPILSLPMYDRQFVDLSIHYVYMKIFRIMASRENKPRERKRRISTHSSDEDSLDTDDEIEEESSSEDSSKRDRRHSSAPKASARRSTERLAFELIVMSRLR